MESARHIRAVFVARSAGRDCTILASQLVWNMQLNGKTLDTFRDTLRVGAAFVCGR